MFSRLLTTLLFITLVSQNVDAWFRVECPSPLVQERVDPIVQPGVVPSQHIHTVHGASSFSSNTTYDDLRASFCTACEVTQDLSNYWFPKLYFHNKTANTYEEVAEGGLLVYYQNRGDGDVSNGGSGLTAFPPGFRMISGDPTLRTKKYPEGLGTQAELAERAIEWSCLRYTVGLPQYDGHGFPTTDCEADKSCWDGVNLDSPDHKSHVAFLSDLDNGSCPSDHPVYMMKLLFEVTWSVHDFADRWDVSDPTAWPFVYGTGDPTGYSWHGDFYSGWDVTALQNAIDHCNNPNDQTGSGVTEACSYLNVQSATLANDCKIDPAINETVGGQVLDALPGCNPLQYGPGDATLYYDGNCPGH